MKLFFLFFVLLTSLNVICGDGEETTESPEIDSPKPEDAKIQRAGSNEKFLVMILFADDNVCIGAMISNVRVVTSPACLEKFKFLRDIYDMPCRVFAGSATDIGTDKGVWRHCLSSEPSEASKRKFKQKMETEVDNKEPSFHKLFKPWENDYIELDVAFDPLLMDIATIGTPAKQGEKCKLYGFKTDTDKESSGDATERPVTLDGNIRHAVYVRNATALSQSECEILYHENMDSDLPRNQFCVVEGGIEDIGRLLFCNNKIAGVVADDLAIVKNGSDTVYAYTNFSAAGRHLIEMFLIIISVIIAVTANENLLHIEELLKCTLIEKKSV